jgi:hypothetical protein
MGSRPTAGYLGFNRVPAASAVNSAAGGVWTLREVEAMRRAGTWPTSAADVSGDPYFSNVVLLLHMDGGNGSTTFTDSSPNPKSVTAAGGATISTAQSRFGGASGLFGNPKQLQIPNSTDFNLSGGDVTIEAWFYAVTLPANVATAAGVLISKDEFGSNFSWHIGVAANGGIFTTNNANTSYIWYSPITTGEWHHIAVSRNGGVMRMFLDGVLMGSVYANTLLTDAAADVTVGCTSYNNPGNFFNGYIDELRVTKGVGRYGSNTSFTPPTAPFPGAGSGLSKALSGAFSSATGDGTPASPLTWSGSPNVANNATLVMCTCASSGTLSLTMNVRGGCGEFGCDSLTVTKNGATAWAVPLSGTATNRSTTFSVANGDIIRLVGVDEWGLQVNSWSAHVS